METIMKRVRLVFMFACLVSFVLLLLRTFVHVDLLLSVGLILFVVSVFGIWISSAFIGEGDGRFARYEDGALKTPTGDRGQLPLGGYGRLGK